MDSCPCGSGNSLEQCCGPYLNGESSPETAEQLMRSRYSAFVLGKIDYIVETSTEETRKELDRKELEVWANESDWKGLEIVETKEGTGNDLVGTVEFKAKYVASGQSVVHHELSDFKKIENKWYFQDGKILRNSVKRDGPKVGRNDPCPCGSGKKFKKCHGK